MLIFLSLFIFLVFCWLGVWQPVHHRKESSVSDYKEAASDLEWIKAHSGEIKPVQPGAALKPLPAGSLLGAVTQEAKNYHITVDRAEPSQDGSIAITVENSAFEQLLLCLASLNTQYGIDIKTIAMTRIAEKPGFVTTTMVLQTRQ